MKIHSAISEKSWSLSEALARICLCEMAQEWTVPLPDAAIKHAERSLRGQEVDPAVLGPQHRGWARLINTERSRSARRDGMHPLAWLRWAYGHAEKPTAMRLALAACEWNCARVALGRLTVMQADSEASKPRLTRFGLRAGRGWPIELFLLAPADQIDLNEPWARKSYSINSLRGVDKMEGASTVPGVAPQIGVTKVAAGSPGVRRSRGKGIEFAVEVALNVFFLEKNDIQRIKGALPGSWPRYQVDNITRLELVKLMRKGCRSLRGYSDSTVVAELSRWVRFPRGKPAHR